MAVERVIGKTDSFEVIFDRLNDNNWTVNVPSNIIGEYVMDLYAYDEAGSYSMRAVYEIADEIIKNKFKIEVK